MAVDYKFVTGWEHGTLGKMLPAGVAPTASTAQKRTGAYSLVCDSFNAGARVDLGSNLAETVYVGVAYRPMSMGSGYTFITFQSANAYEMSIGFSPANQLAIIKHNWTNQTVVATGPTLTANVWYFIEVACLVKNSGGAVTVWVDGVEACAYSGDTCYGAEHIRYVSLGKPYGASGNVPTNGANGYYDDLAIATGGRTGRGGIELLKPTGAGSSTDLTPSAGSNFECVDDVPPDDATTYVSGGTDGDHDSYAMSDLTLEGAVKAVQWDCRAQLAEAGAGGIKRVLRSGGADYLGARLALATAWGWQAECLTNDPATGIAWARAAVDALEAGVAVADDAEGEVARNCTFVGVEALVEELPPGPAGSGLSGLSAMSGLSGMV